MERIYETSKYSVLNERSREGVMDKGGGGRGVQESGSHHQPLRG